MKFGGEYGANIERVLFLDAAGQAVLGVKSSVAFFNAVEGKLI